MVYLNIIFSILLLGYGSLIIYFLFKWDDIPWFKATCKNYHTTVSIIVPFRNEEANLANLLQKLANQDYPPVLYEIIMVNDHSEDDSVKVIEQNKSLIVEKNINLQLINADENYKKGAIETGIKSSGGELIITTDADCQMGEQWLRTIVCYYQQFNFDAASAPVALKSDQGNFFLHLQELEFISLIATGAASVEGGFPIMCNGANLAFKRSAFIESGGYNESKYIASGDDTLLFQKLAKEKKRRLTFIKSADAVVYSGTVNTIRGFLQQRKRWASKVTTSFSLYSFPIALLVYLFNLSLLVTGIGAIFSEPLFRAFILMFSIKVLVDFLFFSSVLKFFNRKRLLFIILPAEVLYIFYVVLVGTIAPFGFYNWKGRTHKR